MYVPQTGQPTVSQQKLADVLEALNRIVAALKGDADIGITLQGLLSVVGGQIQFPATQAASADANTLDDYEEGTWTPTILAGGTPVTSYVLQYGSYTKIGNRVIGQGAVGVNVIGAATGNLQIGGLPFVSNNTANNYHAVSIRGVSLTGLTTESLQGNVGRGVLTIGLEKFNVGTGAALTHSNLSAGATSFIVSFSYMV